MMNCQSYEPGVVDPADAELDCLAAECLCYCHRIGADEAEEDMAATG